MSYPGPPATVFVKLIAGIIDFLGTMFHFGEAGETEAAWRALVDSGLATPGNPGAWSNAAMNGILNRTA